MTYKTISIRNKLMRGIMLICGIVVLITCAVFFLYDFYSFRESTLQNISTSGQIIANNSTAALAFQSKDDAQEILSALKAEPHIVVASIYDSNGQLFCTYPSDYNLNELPTKPGNIGYHFTNTSLEGFQPIAQGTKQLGTLYLKSDLNAMYSRFELYTIIVGLILCFSFILTFLLSKFLQRGVSTPILALAQTAKVISEQKDYSVRAIKLSNDEVGSLTDAFNQMLTQIHEQTEMLNEFNQTLEQRVKNRTTELEVANKELESFSYSVSHDLRAPARAIHSYANVFLEDYGDKIDDEGKRLINIVLKNGQKMGLLIDDLLSFSQLGRKELIKTKLSMYDVVSGIWNELYKAEENRNITLILNELPDVYAEKTTMQQVWVNLISNALKYTKNKHETRIEIYAEEKHGEIIYCIKDNGSGFDMKYYNKLFGVFQRLHSQEEFEGTGVGLAIVQRILEKHGGKIWADSKVNEGATFYFSLPTN
jgi:signal transduction histidine kinase